MNEWNTRDCDSLRIAALPCNTISMLSDRGWPSTAIAYSKFRCSTTTATHFFVLKLAFAFSLPAPFSPVHAKPGDCITIRGIPHTNFLLTDPNNNVLSRPTLTTMSCLVSFLKKTTTKQTKKDGQGARSIQVAQKAEEGAESTPPLCTWV